MKQVGKKGLDACRAAATADLDQKPVIWRTKRMMQIKVVDLEQ